VKPVENEDIFVHLETMRLYTAARCKVVLTLSNDAGRPWLERLDTQEGRSGTRLGDESPTMARAEDSYKMIG